MKLKDVQDRIRKGPNRDDGFAEEFKNKGQAACAEGMGSDEWNEFKDYYFADDQDTLNTLDEWGKDGDVFSNQYSTAAILTTIPACDTIPFFTP